jgi:hypothetical protein
MLYGELVKALQRRLSDPPQAPSRFCRDLPRPVSGFRSVRKVERSPWFSDNLFFS